MPNTKAVYLSKSRLIDFQQCAKRAWLKTYQRELEQVSDSSRAIMSSGTHAGVIAQRMFPGGTEIEFGNTTAALEKTLALLPHKAPIYEACFSASRVLVYIDLLVPDEEGWHLIEVKSSTNVKDYHLNDSAIQTWVAQANGLTNTRTSIATIDNKFVYQGNDNYDGLFYLTDVSDKIAPLIVEVPDWIQQATANLQGEQPNIEIGPHCKKPFECGFIQYCSQGLHFPDYPVTDAKPRKAELEELNRLGIDDLRQAPDNIFASDKSKRIAATVKTGTPFLSAEIHAVTSAIPYPRYYLDFETVAAAVPVWIGTRPYQQIPFQWSCHIEQENGDIEHHEFLADGSGDPREECAQALAELFQEFADGSMIAYNASFEQGVLRQLGERFPEHKKLFNQVCDQTYDLLKIAQAHYYHADMHGSWSIKAVLPTVAPDLSYKDMDIGDGGTAQLMFNQVLQGEISADEAQKIREDLLEYCKLDTWAMVRVARYFEGRAD